MIFNDEPERNIPYGIQHNVYYKWYAGTYWSFSNPSTGDRDGTLKITSIDNDPPYRYHLQLERQSLYLPFGNKSFTLAFSGSLWYYTETNGGYTTTNIVTQSVADVIIADPNQLYQTGINFIVLAFTNDEILSKQIRSRTILKPQIRDYFAGYSLDSTPYSVDTNITLIPQTTENIKLHYYYLESEIQKDSDNVPHPVVSIVTLALQLTASKPFNLSLFAVPCSISLEGDPVLCADIKSQIAALYPKAFPEYLPTIKAYWLSLYEIAKNSYNPSNQNFVANIELSSISYVWAATSRWNHSVISDRNTGLGIGEYIDNALIFNRYFKLNSDGTYGEDMTDSLKVKETRLMVEQLIKAFNALQYQTETPAVIGTGTIDNPQIPATHHLDWYVKNSSIGALLANRITAIWKALGGDKYGTNSIDNTQERVTNLGFLTERIAKVLGIRFDDNGKIDVAKEKSTVRKVIDSSKDIDAEKVGINGYGDDGMALKRINNRVNNKGQIVSDQCVVVQDIPDLIQEYFEQTNLALGIQESSAIEIKQGNKVARFRSQLEILMELVNLMSSGNEMTRAALVSSLVTQSQTNELIAGLGLPSVTKTIPIQIGKKVTQVPFKGIAAHRSISQEVATATYNIGIVLGQVL